MRSLEVNIDAEVRTAATTTLSPVSAKFATANKKNGDDFHFDSRSVVDVSNEHRHYFPRLHMLCRPENPNLNLQIKRSSNPKPEREFLAALIQSCNTSVPHALSDGSKMK